MYHNLKAEMARKNLSAADLADTIGKSVDAVRKNIRGVGGFDTRDALKIRDTHFPECTIEYLFETDGEVEA